MRTLLLLASVVIAGPAAETVRRLPAPEARQGVAAGPRDLYAIANYRIARYDKRTGEKRASWEGDKTRFPHINGCAVIARDLVCASSSFPAVPQWSAIEFFDPRTLSHRRTVALGGAAGSLTWVDRHDGARWAMFANYDAKGGEPQDRTVDRVSAPHGRLSVTGVFPAPVPTVAYVLAVEPRED